jgi:DNA-binding transcriptional MerR regulator
MSGASVGVLMRIGELAEAAGVSVRSLRYYEAQGLLTSNRTATGQRRFQLRDVDRVIQIQELYAAGMCSSKIKELQPCLDAKPEQRTGMLDTELLQHGERLDAAIKDLQRARSTLNEVITAAAEHAADGKRSS